MSNMAVLEGVLERITYANEENGYTVARVDTGRGANDLLTVVGSLLGAQPGESLRMEGRWGSHSQYGKQFTVENYTTILPATIQGIRRYLGSGLIKGIGPVMADRITTHFGVDTLDIIEQQPKRLVEVPGLGPKRTKMIAAAWEEQKAIKEVMVFLQGVGVSTSIAVRIYKKYDDSSISVVKNQPYRLAADVWGIGFLTADKIAQAVGIPHDSPERVKAGLQYALSQSTDQGHCFLPEERLIADAVKLLQVDTGLVIECLAELAEDPEGVVREKVPSPEGGEPVTAVYLVPFHRAEIALAAQVRRLLRTPEERMPAFGDVDWDKALKWLAGRTGATLAPEQEAAVRLALSRKVAVLTGGPGCGKSFTVRSIVELARAKKAKVVLAAPTGRAAKRLSELTGAEASTVHRLLELKPGGDAAYDRDRPLDADLVVVDEASMLDLLLANKLVKAVAPGAHLLLVGDVDQLPSVGAGEVLRDLLADGGPVPAVRLTTIFRQAQQSGVVTNAHRINSGVPPLTQGLSDFFLFVEDETEDAGVLAVDVAARRIPAKFGLNPRRDVQVLAPMHRGPAGAGHLNGLLQQAITPARPDLPEKRFGGRVFRVGDKVTQIRNNYDKGENGVFNGTVGVVTALDVDEQKLTVLTDEDEEISYDFDELDELSHAYAMTIHRSQGSEYPAVVIPVTKSAWMMLQRNLLYTAVTRAKKLVVLVGSRQAIGQAVRTVSAGRRCTALDYRLEGGTEGGSVEKMIDQIGGKHHGGLPEPQSRGQDE
ncbi:MULTISPECIES: ATP-dependent RecD-like DNA helicase [unclassified Streptomyces]|uniref:SF1B family DNA helicase RecD2 n=1 Tax=unclassified Streptomyces TaxID=2593676 RepID=UPI000F49E764|nr:MULTISPECIES: ATP-dependent RecD-like DNA helicase [unclassified Streptomyces]MCX4772505.1 ATP-dependent RecD-like DNA helicase [Streptomyces sp. NBC_01285]